MMSAEHSKTSELLQQAGTGDEVAIQKLLALHRGRLKRMISVRIDPRLTARIDPSDVVQEALMVAAKKLPDYLHSRPIALYPWLRQIAWEKLIEIHRQHIAAARRSVRREEPMHLLLSDSSAMQLVSQFVDSGSHPSRRMVKEELRRRVHAALDSLAEKDREVLVLRYLEQLTTSETAEVLGVTEGVVKGRHRRAVEKLVAVLGTHSGDD